MGWNGTNMRTSWLRLRGNASGRNGAGRPKSWFCAGCQRQHGGGAERTIALDGNSYCARTYWKAHDRIATERAALQCTAA